MPFDGIHNALGELGLTEIHATRVRQWRNFIYEKYRNQSGHSAGWQKMPRIPLASFATIYPSAPKAVRHLADQIATAIPSMVCTVEYYDTDPILYVNDGDRRFCIAIWDKGVVRAIADGTPKLSIGQRVLRRVVKTV